MTPTERALIEAANGGNTYAALLCTSLMMLHEKEPYKYLTPSQLLIQLIEYHNRLCREAKK